MPYNGGVATAVQTFEATGANERKAQTSRVGCANLPRGHLRGQGRYFDLTGRLLRAAPEQNRRTLDTRISVLEPVIYLLT